MRVYLDLPGRELLVGQKSTNLLRNGHLIYVEEWRSK